MKKNSSIYLVVLVAFLASIFLRHKHQQSMLLQGKNSAVVVQPRLNATLFQHSKEWDGTSNTIDPYLEIESGNQSFCVGHFKFDRIHNQCTLVMEFATPAPGTCKPRVWILDRSKACSIDAPNKLPQEGKR